MDLEAAPPDVAEAQAALLRDEALQFSLPSAGPSPPAAYPWRLPIGFGDAGVTWVLAALGVVLAVGLALAYLRNRPAPAAAPRPGAGPDTLPPAAARLALGDADDLAAAGRHLDGARALLLCGLDAIAERHPGLLRPTTTSRDITREPALPEPQRRDFGRIARVVETGLFGDRPVDADDYAECRRAFLAAFAAGGRA